MTHLPNNPLADPVIRYNYCAAAVHMAILTLPLPLPEEMESLHKDVRGKLHECILAVKEPILRRQLRILATAHGLDNISELFPSQPITESPISEEAVNVGPMVDAFLKMSRSDAARFFAEITNVGKSLEGRKKYGRSDEYLNVFGDAGKSMGQLSVKTNPGLRRTVEEAVRKQGSSGEYPSPPPLPEKPVFGP